MIRYEVMEKTGKNNYLVKVYQKQENGIQLVIEDERDIELEVEGIYESDVKISIEFTGVVSRDTVIMKLVTNQVKKQTKFTGLKPFVKISGIMTAETKGKRPSTKYIRVKLDDNVTTADSEASGTLSIYVGEELNKDFNYSVGEHIKDMDIKLHTLDTHRIVGVYVQPKQEGGKEDVIKD